MAIKKGIFKRFDGTEWHDYYFKTSTDMVEGLPSAYVDRTSAQTVAGEKTFTDRVRITKSTSTDPGLRIRGNRPNMLFETDNMTGGVAFSIMKGVVNSPTGSTTVGNVGLYGSGTGTTPTGYYMFFDSRPDGAWNNATLKVDSQNRVGVAIGSSTRPSQALDVNGKIRMRTQTAANDADDIVATKKYVDDQVSLIPKFAIEVVDNLPTGAISTETVYIVNGEEFLYVNGEWEKLGSFDVNIGNYYSKAEADAKFLTGHQSLEGYATESWVNQKDYVSQSGLLGHLTNYQTKAVSDLAYLGKTAQAADSAKLGGSNASDFAKKANETHTGTTIIGGLKINQQSKNIIGTTANATVFDTNKVWFEQGALFYGTALSAGLITRGISGTNSSGTAKDSLYINYDGNNTYKTNRHLVLQAGAPGTHYGHNLYQYAAARGDAVKAYVDNEISTISLTPGPEGPQGPQGPKGDRGERIFDISYTTLGAPNTINDIPIAEIPFDAREGDFIITGDNYFYELTSKNEQFGQLTTWSAKKIAYLIGSQGPKGDDGADGKDGQDGKDGADGLPGQAATVSVGTTTTSASGGNASVTQTGDAQNRTFNFVIPRGEKGEKGTASLNSIDVRGDDTPGSLWDLAPTDMDNQSITSYFSQFPASDGMGTSWKSLLNIKGWSGATYANWQLIGPASTLGTDEGLFYRTGNSTSGWSTPRRIYHSGNLSNLRADLGTVTTSVNGLMSSADKTKLNSIATVATTGSYNDLTNKLTAGDNITIENNVISASGGSGDYELTKSKIDTALAGSNSNALQLGNSATASGTSSTALGRQASASGTNSTALGQGASASGLSSIALGYMASSGTSSTALGRQASASGTNSTAIGYYATASGDGSTALGRSSTTGTSNNAMRLGHNSLSTLTSQVSLTVTSDIRDKADIEEVPKALDFIKDLNPITYVSNDRDNYISEEQKETETYKDYLMVKDYDRKSHSKGTKKGSRRRVGLSAQEVRDKLIEHYGSDNYANVVNDNFVEFEERNLDIPKGLENKLTMSYETMVPFLIKAIQEQQEQIEELKKKINSDLS